MSSESDEILSSESGETLNWSDLSVDTQSIREGSNTVEVPSSMSTNNSNNEEASGAAANEFDNQSRRSNLLAGVDVEDNNNNNIDVDNRSDGNSNRSIGRLPPVPPHQHQPRNTNNNNYARDPSVQVLFYQVMPVVVSTTVGIIMYHLFNINLIRLVRIVGTDLVYHHHLHVMVVVAVIEIIHAVKQDSLDVLFKHQTYVIVHLHHHHVNVIMVMPPLVQYHL